MALLQRLASAWSSLTQGQSGFTTPDVTKAQQIAVGQAVVVLLVVLGFNLDAETQQLLIGLSAALAAALPVSDAVVRHGRASNLPAIEKAQKESGASAQPKASLVSPAERELILADLLSLTAARLPADGGD